MFVIKNLTSIFILLALLSQQVFSQTAENSLVPEPTRQFWQISDKVYSFPTPSVYGVKQRHSESWYSTRSGLFILDSHNQLQRWIGRPQGLPDEGVSNYYFDGEKYWLPSRLGLAVYDHEADKLERVAPDLLNRYFFRSLPLSFYGDYVLTGDRELKVKVHRKDLSATEIDLDENQRIKVNSEAYPVEFLNMSGTRGAAQSFDDNVSSWHIPQYGSLLPASDSQGVLWSMTDSQLEKFDLKQWQKTTHPIPNELSPFQNAHPQFIDRVLLLDGLIIAGHMVFHKALEKWQAIELGNNHLIGVLQSGQKALFLLGVGNEMEGSVNYRAVVEVDSEDFSISTHALVNNDAFKTLFPDHRILGGALYFMTGLSDYQNAKQPMAFPDQFESAKAFVAREYDGNPVLYFGGGNGVHWFGSEQRYRLTAYRE